MSTSAHPHPEHGGPPVPPAPPAPHVIIYTVDGEDQRATEHELAVGEILRRAGLDPAERYLIELRGKHQVPYKDPAEVIRLHPNQKFISAFTGATPVSHENTVTGTEAFEEQLRALGYTPVRVRPDFVAIEYQVQGGRLDGRDMKLAWQIPPEFPRTPPGGPHISPRMLPMNPGAPGHPERVADSPLGGDWQYLSRPHPSWPRSGRTVKAYLDYMRSLFATT